MNEGKDEFEDLKEHIQLDENYHLDDELFKKGLQSYKSQILKEYKKTQVCSIHKHFFSCSVCVLENERKRKETKP